jgi:hypothetical protein
VTIAAAYLTSDGVVLGADSTTTVIASGGVVQLFNCGQKVFEIGKDSRLGLCTWGAGSLAGTSHRTLVARLADRIDLSRVTVQEATNVFTDIVSQAYGAGDNIGGVGYVIGGWNLGSHEPDCYALFFEPRNEPKCSAFSIGQAMFFGNPEFFGRVFEGYDSKLPAMVLAKLREMNLGIPDDRLTDALNQAFATAVIPLKCTGFPDLPIREAIDFVHMYLHVTVKAFKFRFGPPVCGGPIEIAFISTDRSFRWVTHKDFARAIYEQEAQYE